MDFNPDLDLRKKLAPGFDLDFDLSSLSGFGFDLDLQGWRICTPLANTPIAFYSPMPLEEKL